MPEVTQRQERPSSSAFTVPAIGGASLSSDTPQSGPAAFYAQARLLVKGMRPRQWTKNLPIFAGITFAGRLLIGLSLARAVTAFAVFCLLAGATYLINDLADLEQDRIHPTKRLRPLASGRLAKRTAYIGIGVSLLLAAAGAALILALPLPVSHKSYHLALRFWPPQATLVFGHNLLPGDAYTAFGGSGILFAILAVAYFILMLSYTFRLKHIVLLDIFTIAAGFVLRAMAGAVAVAVHISPWFYLCTILLALFLALGKRRQELLSLEHNASAHRRILSEYTPQLLDQLITVVTSATIMAYSLYTFQGETGDRRLMVTIPFVLYGVFRYLYLVYARGEGGSPEEILLRDTHVRWSVVLCAITVALVLYVLP